jgi:hypothetical protein
VGERTRKERRRRKEEKSEKWEKGRGKREEGERKREREVGERKRNCSLFLFLAGGLDRISAMRFLAASALGWNFGIWA